MGRRGESWVIVQAVLLTLIVFAPKLEGAWPMPGLFQSFGWLLVALGVLGLAWSAKDLGRSLTPFPRPLADGRLVTDGAYRWVRHPIYFALLLIAFGFSLATMNGSRLILSVLLFFFLDRKARLEEK